MEIQITLHLIVYDFRWSQFCLFMIDCSAESYEWSVNMMNINEFVANYDPFLQLIRVCIKDRMFIIIWVRNLPELNRSGIFCCRLEMTIFHYTYQNLNVLWYHLISLPLEKSLRMMKDISFFSNKKFS